MSDNANNAAPKKAIGWSEHEIYLCLMNIIEKSGVQPDFKNIAYPPGRTAKGFSQKFVALKKDLKPELDAINSGQPLSDAPAFKNKSGDGSAKSTLRKRKSNDDGVDGEDESTKKRGGSKKNASSEPEEMKIKEEPKGELASGAEI
ncbi:hypothetical protein EK21DRAFT_111497 [Setomelanomma holmii]|uniref:Uncharacterized protein n=1 Tax=Setomelanomma holmii TaxID=210430 RepID=A0A9P4HC09_9PLEO|nr:hypothetical protein EK21DRAFT_111497 [Setomelanomma holmii]